MSKAVDEKETEFIWKIRETFESHTKSRQYRWDHPDGELYEWDNSESAPTRKRHNDGRDIQFRFALEPTFKYLRRAAKEEHSVAKHPKALPHFITHINPWEKWELGEEDPDFSDLPRLRKGVMEWFAGMDADDREKAADNRQETLRDGGTGLIIHGEQGRTKTTAMYWLIANIMQINQQENVIWQSTLDDTEWQVFGPWATVCLPEGVDVEVTANPHSREYRGIGPFEIELEDIARQVVRYEDPKDLLELMAGRKPGHFYVVYPDPKFRLCESLTTWEYQNMWEVDEANEATKLDHFWFALMEAVVHGYEYNDWTTIVSDEAHKWLKKGKGNDEHDWWNKIDDWSTYWGDARKKRLSCILSVHKWNELHPMVKGKVRWGATMNGEDFPSEAPLDGKNSYDQGLGDMCVWNSENWNHVGYPDIKRKFSVPADFEVRYPGFDALKRSKS